MRNKFSTEKKYGVFKIYKTTQRRQESDELAKRLSLDVEEIQKAEDGEDVDQKTLEAISRYFGIQYDSLVEGTVKSKKKESIFDPTEWYKLDNAAKVYPSSSSNEYSSSALRR